MGAYKVSIKFLLNINDKFFKIEYLFKLRQYFENFAKECFVCDLMTAFEILAELNKVFNFEKLLIYV